MNSKSTPGSHYHPFKGQYPKMDSLTALLGEKNNAEIEKIV